MVNRQILPTYSITRHVFGGDILKYIFILLAEYSNRDVKRIFNVISSLNKEIREQALLRLHYLVSARQICVSNYVFLKKHVFPFIKKIDQCAMNGKKGNYYYPKIDKINTENIIKNAEDITLTSENYFLSKLLTKYLVENFKKIKKLTISFEIFERVLNQLNEMLGICKFEVDVLNLQGQIRVSNILTWTKISKLWLVIKKLTIVASDIGTLYHILDSLNLHPEQIVWIQSYCNSKSAIDLNNRVSYQDRITIIKNPGFSAHFNPIVMKNLVELEIKLSPDQISMINDNYLPVLSKLKLQLILNSNSDSTMYSGPPLKKLPSDMKDLVIKLTHQIINDLSIKTNHHDEKLLLDFSIELPKLNILSIKCDHIILNIPQKLKIVEINAVSLQLRFSPSINLIKYSETNNTALFADRLILSELRYLKILDYGNFIIWAPEIRLTNVCLLLFYGGSIPDLYSNSIKISYCNLNMLIGPNTTIIADNIDVWCCTGMSNLTKLCAKKKLELTKIHEEIVIDQKLMSNIIIKQCELVNFLFKRDRTQSENNDGNKRQKLNT